MNSGENHRNYDIFLSQGDRVGQGTRECWQLWQVANACFPMITPTITEKTVIRGLHPGSGLTVASLSLDAGCHGHHNTADGGGNLAALLMPAAAALETARHEETLGTMEIIREGGDKAVSAS